MDEQERWEAQMWNVIARHPAVEDARTLFSRRNEIAKYVIPEVDTEIRELIRCFEGQRERWDNDYGD